MSTTGRYVDAHVHLWDRSLLTYAWLDTEPALADRYHVADYERAAGPAAPEAFVFVQADASDDQAEAEVEWVRWHSAETAMAGIVAFAPVASGPDELDAYLRRLGRDRLVGVRQLIQDHGRGYCTTDPFVAAVARLAEHELTFDACVRHHQLDDVAVLASAASSTRIVLDHLGKPPIGDATVFETWRADVERLAQRENVAAKLSGLVTEAPAAARTADALEPYVAVALEAFGPDRLLWGSDWPVVDNAADHQGWRTITSRLLAALSDAEQQRIWLDTAREVYRLDAGSGP